MRPKVPQYVEVECDFMSLHCPICGQIANADSLPEDACPHLAFAHIEEGGFIYQSDDFRKRTKKVKIEMIKEQENNDDEAVQTDDVDEESDEYDCYDEDWDGFPSESVKALIERSGYSNNLVSIEITYESGGCGPSWVSDIYGYDFSTYTNPEDDDEEEEEEADDKDQE
jgi:hypothetical protein